MSGNVTRRWSIGLGQWIGADWRLHVHFPLAAVGIFFVAMKVAPDGIRSETLQAVTIGIIVWFGTIVIHQLSQLMAVCRLGGELEEIMLRPTGGTSPAILPANPPVHLVMALIGPMSHVVMMVVAACLLVLAGEPHLLELLRPFAPGLQVDSSTSILVLQLIVWINGWLLLIDMLPMEPQSGLALAKALLWPIVGQASTTIILHRVAIGSAILTASMAVLFSDTLIDQVIPAWFPLAILAILLGWSGGSNSQPFHEDVSELIDPFLFEDSPWPPSEWFEEETTNTILVEQVRDVRQESLDQKRRDQEVVEDARVDAILARLQECRFEQLPEEDRTILRRASRRYRKRRGEPEREI